MQDSKVVQNNCKIGANGEKDWQHIQQYKAVKSFVLFHALTHFTYASETQPLDYAYNLWDCKKLRDGKHKNENFCKDEPEAMCKADKSFKNADTLAFVATGVYWEAQCEKEIDTEVGLSSTTENLDPFWNADEEDTNPSSDTDRGLTDEPDETLDSPEDAGGEPTPRGKRDAPTPEDEGGKPTRKGNGDKPAPSKKSAAKPPTPLLTPKTSPPPSTNYAAKRCSTKRCYAFKKTPRRASAPKWSTRTARPFPSVEPLIVTRMGIHVRRSYSGPA